MQVEFELRLLDKIASDTDRLSILITKVALMMSNDSHEVVITQKV